MRIPSSNISMYSIIDNNIVYENFHAFNRLGKKEGYTHYTVLDKRISRKPQHKKNRAQTKNIKSERDDKYKNMHC